MTTAADIDGRPSGQGGRAWVEVWIRAWAPRLLVLCAVGMVLWLAPAVLQLPVPRQATALTEAQLQVDGGRVRTVSLPHDWRREIGPGPATATYSLRLPASPPDEPMVLLLPSTRLLLAASLNGQPLEREAPQITGTKAGSTALFRLPSGTRGDRLDLTLRRDGGIVPGHLSPVHLARESDVAQTRWLWVMGDGVIRMVALCVHVLTVFAIAVVWTARRRDPIFGWLFLLGAGSLLNVLSGSALEPAWLSWSQKVVPLIISALGLAVVGLALAVLDVRRPRWLRYGVVLLPLILILGTMAGLPVPIGRLTAFLVAIGGNLAGGVLLLGLGRRPAPWDQLLLAAPFLLTGCFALRDMAGLFGLVADPFMMTSHVRTLIIVAILALLMRRLAASLNELDVANETQRRRLEEQEAELTRLHAEAQERMAQLTLDEERRRLMRDLHDGVSGHLVSIIALSERERVHPKDIESAARAALEDLRLVIDSLDLEDGDLRLALAGFRERLTPQLRRLGVDFAWSMEALPEVGGVAPTNALAILRILQEAITNALKHGSARRIEVRGTKGAADAAVLTVTNDSRAEGRAPASATGRGLDNMRRRARQLGGDVVLRLGETESSLTLTLPAVLSG